MKQKRSPFGMRRRWAFFIALLIAVIVVLSRMLVWQSRLPTVVDQLCLMIGYDRDDEVWAECVIHMGTLSKAIQAGMSYEAAYALALDNINETAEAALAQMPPEEIIQHATQTVGR